MYQADPRELEIIAMHQRLDSKTTSLYIHSTQFIDRPLPVNVNLTECPILRPCTKALCHI